jgi:hypothetical protein
VFKIDLLKGQGIPIKSRPEGIAVAVITFAVPLIITVVMFGCYLHTGIVMSIQRQGIVNYEKRIRELSVAVELQRSFEEKKSTINNCLSEVSSSIGRHSQWSPVLVTMVKNMPDSVILTALELKDHLLRKKVPDKTNPKQMVDVAVTVRTLKLTVSGDPRYNHDKAVRDFADRLRFSTLLGPKLEEIRVSQESGKLQGTDVVSYGMDCVFKAGL